MTNADRAGGVVAHIVGTPYGNGFAIEDDAIPVLAEGERIPLVRQSLLIEAQAEVDMLTSALDQNWVQHQRIVRAEADAERYRFLRDGGISALHYEDIGLGPMYPDGDDLDTAIDKARGGREG